MFERLKELFGIGTSDAEALKMAERGAAAGKPIGVSLAQLPASARKVKLQYQFAFAAEEQIDEGRCRDRTGTEYQVHGRNYVDISSLETEKVLEYTKDIVWFKDAYGYPVLALYESIPTVEASEREWDGLRALYLVYDGTDIFGVYCVRGYHIARLIVYDKMLYAERSVREFFDDMEFPMDRLDPFDSDDPARL